MYVKTAPRRRSSSIIQSKRKLVFPHFHYRLFASRDATRDFPSHRVGIPLLLPFCPLISAPSGWQTRTSVDFRSYGSFSLHEVLKKVQLDLLGQISKEGIRESILLPAGARSGMLRMLARSGLRVNFSAPRHSSNVLAC
jgi:hypothetical protein